MLYPDCHSICLQPKQIQMFTLKANDEQQQEIWKRGFNSNYKSLKRSKAACQLFVNVVYKEIKQFLWAA